MKPSQPRTVAEILGPPGPFYRSVSIERDRHDHAAMRGYVLTPWLERVSTEILQGLLPGSRRRAWRITGDFGVGKSALALALIRTLEADPAAADLPMGKFTEAFEHPMPRLFPLVISGSRDGFAAALARAIARTREAEGDLLPSDRYGEAPVDPVEAVIRLRNDLVGSGRYQGLLLVVDEMGKFLEVAASDPEGGDVFRLQELAEAAARSDNRPLSLLLLLHQGL